jgi:hypothetical protein
VAAALGVLGDAGAKSAAEKIKLEMDGLGK